jgi:hypothetical protein
MPKHAPPPAGIPNPDARLWERFVGETEKQFLAFKAYRDQSPASRTIIEAYRRHTGKTSSDVVPSWFYELSGRNRWRERASAFDAHLDRLAWEAENDERLKARRLRRAVLLTAQKRLGDAVQGFDFAKSTPAEIAKLLDVVARNLREEYGEQPTQRQEVTVVDGGKSDLVALADRADTMTDDELVAEYRRISSSDTGKAADNNGAGGDAG